MSEKSKPALVASFFTYLALLIFAAFLFNCLLLIMVFMKWLLNAL